MESANRTSACRARRMEPTAASVADAVDLETPPPGKEGVSLESLTLRMVNRLLSLLLSLLLLVALLSEAVVALPPSSDSFKSRGRSYIFVPCRHGSLEEYPGRHR